MRPMKLSIIMPVFNQVSTVSYSGRTYEQGKKTRTDVVPAMPSELVTASHSAAAGAERVR